MTEWLLSIALKENRDYGNRHVRIKVGYLAGTVGVIINLVLAITKLSIGLIISSIGVVADGVNNFADSASAVVTLLGFKLSNMPADKEHPYGHGRLEYVSALIVAFMVIVVGLQFIRSSYERIINPEPVEFQLIPFLILGFSILFKVWLSIFNRELGNRINSTGLKATATDALGDVLITSVVVLSIVTGQFTKLPIDGIVGVVVSLFIIYAGYSLVKDTISPLIGEAPSDEITDAIYDEIMTYDYITGAHDLVIHSYGAGRTMATIDVEFPGNIDVITIHDVIDQAEREVGEKFDMTLVIHMDPIGTESPERQKLRNKVKRIAKEDKRVKSIHDFHLEETEDGITIEFHAVVSGELIEKGKSFEEVKRELEEKVEQNIETAKCKVILDIDF
ncbi:MAG: cation diffusion facilitator family transporter [Gudongella sp.]|jgi:cation diffusion facilitator family transporter|nr:cation diffusion facilitator family transporter [Gudongella sp.]